MVARWDTGGTLTAELKPLVVQLRARLDDKDLPDDQRATVIANLVGVRNFDPQIVPQVAALLGSAASVPLQMKTLEALGSTRERTTGSELVAAYLRVPPELQDPIFGQIIKRADWSLVPIGGKHSVGFLVHVTTR